MNKISYVGECSVMSVDNSSIIDLNKTPCTKDCVDTNLSHDCDTPTTFDKPRQHYFRERYVNITPERGRLDANNERVIGRQDERRSK